MATGDDVAVSELTGVLRRQHRLLDRLLFRLTELDALLMAHETRYLGWAITDVERAAETLREDELRRSAAVDAVAGATVTAEGSPRLSDLAVRLGTPYDQVLGDHAVGLRRLVAEVEATAVSCRVLAAEGLACVRADLAHVGGSAPMSDHLDAIDPAGVALDLEMAAAAYGAAIVASSWYPSPGLRALLA